MPRKRAPADRTATTTEYLVCPFDVHEFAKTGGKQLTELGRTLNLNASNFHNWRVQMPGMVPLSVAKALVLSYLPEHLPEFEATIDGKIARRPRPVFITDETAALAREYDQRRADTRLGMTSGETYVIPPRRLEDADVLGHIPAAEPELPPELPPEEPATIAAEVLAATHLPPAPPPSNSYTLQTPAGPITVTLPEASSVTMGEREILTALTLQLNVQLIEAHRQLHEERIVMRSLESERNALRGRVKELIEHTRELVETSRTTAAKGIATVASATKPVLATNADYERVKAAVRQVPELERLVAALQAETVKVHEGAPSAGFPQGAAGATSLH